MSTHEQSSIADHAETLRLLTEQARKGSVTATVALERALRAASEQERRELDEELALLTK